MSENVRYLDAERYEALHADAERLRSRTVPSALPHRDIAASLLFQEARLLDGGDYEQWLALYTEDCVYWVPAEPEVGDPRREASVNFDDRRRIADRIALIRTGYLHAQTPPSRTARAITNIETWQPRPDVLEVRSVLTLWMHRRGDTVAFVGHQDHQLVHEGECWKIRCKIIRLVDCDQPLGNISFIL